MSCEHGGMQDPGGGGVNCLEEEKCCRMDCMEVSMAFLYTERSFVIFFQMQLSLTKGLNIVHVCLQTCFLLVHNYCMCT